MPAKLVSWTDLRILGAAVAISVWLVLLLTGWAFGGLVHLLLVAGLVLAPWRALPETTAQIVDRPECAVGESGDGETE